jgi:hypothetical protein
MENCVGVLILKDQVDETLTDAAKYSFFNKYSYILQSFESF